MINYEILGPVTARHRTEAARFTPQQQLLVARLVTAAGRPVTRAALEAAVWDGEAGDGLKRVVSEVRAKLHALLPGNAADPLPAAADGYRLPLRVEQADVLRFQARLAEAQGKPRPSAVPLLRAALGEWGPGTAGLYGGDPLSGLGSRWADHTRTAFRRAYRDSRFQCLQQEMDDHEYDRLAWECEQLATDLDTLHDEQFLELWLHALYRAGHRVRALEIYRHSADSAAVHLGGPLRKSLRQLAQAIKDEDPRLGDPAPVPGVPRPRSIRNSQERTAVTEPQTTITVQDNANVGSIIGHVTGNVVLGNAPAQAGDSPQEADQPGASQAREEDA